VPDSFVELVMRIWPCLWPFWWSLTVGLEEGFWTLFWLVVGTVIVWMQSMIFVEYRLFVDQANCG
jgi:hypothetical protein